MAVRDEHGVFNVATQTATTPEPSVAEGNGHAGGVPREAPSGDEESSLPDRPSGERALRANPLYATGRLSPLPCPAPEVQVDDPAAMERFLYLMTDCLDQVWETQFAKAGLSFQPPERVFWTQPGTSPCRDYPSSAGAFYCQASQGLYIGVSDVVKKWNGAENSVVYASLLAHEYGHHVQAQSGLLEYYHDQRSQEPTVVDRNAWTRRGELQANCLAGAFLGSISASYPLDAADRSAVLDDAAATADRENSPPSERTHGSAANSVMWTEHGMRYQSPGACNTWNVEADLVS
ncbi:neutral zinc metallopeptidase [Salinactinospora qingdaonensis]|uniref:Neutral zinc metallopeptidase n=2 Tax=Salinactinospora qingdaonensis TaxID=702744 RepID=A0ABP7F1P3_9ACTN